MGLFVLTLSMQAGCSDEATPKFEAWEHDNFQDRAVSGYELSGARDGATTKAIAIVTLASGQRLTLEFELFYDPTPALASGRWRLGDGEPWSDELQSESLRFLGGQGDGVSVGGSFRLLNNGELIYRVSLPLRSIGDRGWKP